MAMAMSGFQFGVGRLSFYEGQGGMGAEGLGMNSFLSSTGISWTMTM